MFIPAVLFLRFFPEPDRIFQVSLHSCYRNGPGLFLFISYQSRPESMFPLLSLLNPGADWTICFIPSFHTRNGPNFHNLPSFLFTETDRDFRISFVSYGDVDRNQCSLYSLLISQERTGWFMLFLHFILEMDWISTNLPTFLLQKRTRTILSSTFLMEK